MAWRSRKYFKQAIIALCLCVSGFCIGHATAEDVNQKHSSTALGISFEFPSRFLIGEFQKEEQPKGLRDSGIESSFNSSVVLVEPTQLGELPLMAIPVGEVPTISLNLQSGQHASFTKRMFFKGEYEKTIGAHTVYQLPGYPGPYGDQAYYYLIPASADNVLEIMAHRYYFRDGTGGRPEVLPETGYDKYIENIIQSLEFNQGPDTRQAPPERD